MFHLGALAGLVVRPQYLKLGIIWALLVIIGTHICTPVCHATKA